MTTNADISGRLAEVLAAPPIPAADYFARAREVYPSRGTDLDDLEQYYNNKLYHQLSEESAKFVKTIDDRIEVLQFFHSVLTPIREKLNAVSYLELVDHCAQRFDPQDALALVNHVEPWYRSEEEDSFLVIQLIRANTLIGCNELPAASAILFGKIIELLGKRIGVDLQISSAFHKASLKYFKALNDPQEFYTSAQLFLAYTPLASIDQRDRVQLAFELCVAALRTPSFFDFSEIRSHPILNDLLSRDTDRAWVTTLVNLACSGALETYTNEFLPKYHDRMIDIFGKDEKIVDQKIRLSALVTLSAAHAVQERPASFDTVVERCGVPPTQVEKFLIRAMSMNLIRGKIDEVDREIKITWVRPRLGEADRAEDLRKRFDCWSSMVQQLASQLEEATSDYVTTPSAGLST